MWPILNMIYSAEKVCISTITELWHWYLLFALPLFRSNGLGRLSCRPSLEQSFTILSLRSAELARQTDQLSIDRLTRVDSKRDGQIH